MKSDFQVQLENQKGISFYGGLAAGFAGTVAGGFVLLSFGAIGGLIIFLLWRKVKDNQNSPPDWANRKSPGSVTDK